MEPWKLLLLLSLTVYAVRCLNPEESAPEIICHVNIYPEINRAIPEMLGNCDHVIVSYDSLCDLAKHFFNFSDAKRVELIRVNAPEAKILRQIELQFGESFDPVLAAQNIKNSLVGGLFDGVELIFDPAHLDHREQVKYTQFLDILKQNLNNHELITNSFICEKHLPKFLLNAMRNVLDYIILIPSSQTASMEGSFLEPRMYSDSVAECLANAQFPRNKIVLGLPTGGVLVNSSLDRESLSGLIPYGKVCEISEEQQRHCEERQHKNCSFFREGVKLIYDDSNSAGRRALQCVGCRLRGIAIGLSYDDQAGVCVGSSFPLLEAVQNVFEYRSGVLGFHGCPSDSEESDVDAIREHNLDISSHSNDLQHLDSDETIDCSCAKGKLCNGCHLKNRIRGTLKRSDNVARISKSVTDKVLASLDRVVSLVSLLLQYRPKLPLVARIPLGPVGPPVIQPDTSTSLSEEVDQNVLTGPKAEQTISEHQISPSAPDPVQTFEASQNVPPVLDHEQNDGEINDSPNETDLAQNNEASQNVPPVLDLEQNDEKTHNSESEQIVRNPPSSFDSEQNDEESNDSPTESDPGQNDEETHNSQTVLDPVPTDDITQNSHTGSDTEQTLEQNQSITPNDEGSATEPNPEQNDDGNHSPSGPIQSDDSHTVQYPEQNPACDADNPACV